jgi:hypothetical protein
VLVDNKYTWGWVQTAINVSDGHTPKPPTQGLPGDWISTILAGSQAPIAMWVWIPTPADSTTPPPDGGTPPVDPNAPHPEPFKREKKHS